MEKGKKSKEESEDDMLERQDWSDVPFWTSQRFLMALMMFLGCVTQYLQRINFSIAIVSMVKSSSPHTVVNASLSNSSDMWHDGVNQSGFPRTSASLKPMFLQVMHSANSSLQDMITSTMTPTQGSEDYCDSLETVKKLEQDGEFEWDKELQGLLLGSFFWGYLMLQIPTGVLSERYGPRRVVFCCLLPVAIFNLISPVCARLSPWLFLVVRVCVGLGGSCLYPATHALLARWSPPSERSRLVGGSLAGSQLGNAMIFPLGGFLCSEVNWDSVFYLTGGLGFVWAICWVIIVADSPDKCKRISKIEREYLRSQVAPVVKQSLMDKPWKSFFTSIPFWAIVAAHFCGNYGLYMMLTQIPTYMKEVLKFDLKSNGVFSMMPYLVMWVFITIAGTVADLLMNKGWLGRLATRKLMSSLGTFGPAICMVALTFMDCRQQIGAVLLLCGAVGLSGLPFAGYLVNHADIAPQHAGTLFGLSNMFATVSGIVAPYVVGAVTKHKTREEWQIAFYIASAIYVLGGVIYLIFAKTTRQKWAETSNSTNYEMEIPERRSMLETEESNSSQHREKI